MFSSFILLSLIIILFNFIYNSRIRSFYFIIFSKINFEILKFLETLEKQQEKEQEKQEKIELKEQELIGKNSVSTQVEEIDWLTLEQRGDVKIKKSEKLLTLNNILGIPSLLRGENHYRIQMIKYQEIEKLFQTEKKEIETQTDQEMMDVEVQTDEIIPIFIPEEKKQIPIPKIEIFENPIETEELYLIENDINSIDNISLIPKTLQNLIKKEIKNESTPRKWNEKKEMNNISLYKIPISILEESSIIQLNVSNNLLTFLPNYFFENLKSLTQLNLSNNLLFNIPDQITELKKLKELDLSFNRLEFIPNSILNLISISNLYFNNNLLLCIPNDIIKLKNSLNELDISNNFIYELPDDIKKMKLKLKFNNNPFIYFTVFDILKNYQNFERKKDIILHLKKEFIMNKIEYILLEFLESERKYYKYLKIFQEVFLKGTNEDLKKLNVIPKNMNHLISFSENFLIQIEKELRDLERFSLKFHKIFIGKIFLKNMKEMRIEYLQYPNEYKLCTDIIKKEKEKNENIFKKKYYILDGIDYEIFLTLPFSRIEKYENLLKLLLLNNIKNDLDFDNINSSFIEITNLLNDLNFEIGKINNKYRILELSKKWKMDDLNDPLRYLIREDKLKVPASKEIESIKNDLQSIGSFSNKLKNLKGVSELSSYFTTSLSDLRLSESQIHLYLFNDIFLIEETSFVSKNIFKPLIINLKMEGIQIESSVNSENEFIIHLPYKKSLHFICEDEKKRNEWFKDFWDVLHRLNFEQGQINIKTNFDQLCN